MSIVRWDPFRELEDMSERLNRVFGRSGLTRGEPASKDTMTVFDWSPTVDIVETPEEFQIKAELPEVKKEDVKVSVDRGVLRIEGERKQEKEEKGKKYHRLERSYGSFLRTFTLPDTVDETKVQAEFKDGMLNVRLHKAEKAKPNAADSAPSRVAARSASA
jgi:HSP20 family protein